MTQRLNKTPISAFRQAGFTLIEMLIVISVIAILARIAIPAYRDSTLRGKIPDGTSNLAIKRLQLEQWFQDNPTVGYIGAPACVNDTATSQYFNFSCTVQTLNTFTVQALGKDDMTGFTFTIDQNGTRRTTAAPAGWPTSNTCWISKRGDSC